MSRTEILWVVALAAAFMAITGVLVVPHRLGEKTAAPWMILRSGHLAPTLSLLQSRGFTSTGNT